MRNPRCAADTHQQANPLDLAQALALRSRTDVSTSMAPTGCISA
jgi:hypothetical protein